MATARYTSSRVTGPTSQSGQAHWPACHWRQASSKVQRPAHLWIAAVRIAVVLATTAYFCRRGASDFR